MKKLLLVLLLLSTVISYAQEKPRVLLHLQSADTLVYKSIVNQISNIKKEFPEAEVELVCHGPGLDFLLKRNSKYIDQLQKMNLKDVLYVGCEFTMSQKKIKKEALADFALTVPYGLAEIIRKQQQNWLYVKLGF